MSEIDKNISELRQRVDKSVKEEMFAAQDFLSKTSKIKIAVEDLEKESYFDKLHQKWVLCREATQLHRTALNVALMYVDKLKRLKEKEGQLLSEINSILADIDQLEKQ